MESSPASGRRFTLSRLMLTIAGIAAGCAVLAWLGRSVYNAREAARDMVQAGRVSQIRLALYNYEAEYGTFPPVYTTDANGRPLTSWRVLILPYLEEDSLFKAYDQSQPWDSSENELLLSQIPIGYESRSGSQDNPNGLTPYVAITGPGTLWEKPAEILSHSNSSRKDEAIFICNNRQMVPWTKPDDCSQKDFELLLRSLDKPDGSIWVMTPSAVERARPIHAQMSEQLSEPSSTSSP